MAISGKKAVIVSAVRTPIGRYGGMLANVRPDDLAAIAIRGAIDRAGIAGESVEDVIFGCANQAGEDNRNVARMALLLAGLPVEAAGVTVNRLCGSSLEATLQAARAIKSGEGDVFIAGGVESMSRSPWVVPKVDSAFPRGNMEMVDTTLGWRLINPRMSELYPIDTLGETAENVAERYQINRSIQDQFAYESQQRWARAQDKGLWNDEIVGVKTRDKKGNETMLLTDEHPRPSTSLEKLSALAPAFRQGGTVTAGNSSGLNDGAAALVIMSDMKARELGLKPIAQIVSGAVAGVHPSYMGIGPVPASQKALARAGWSASDIDLVEINEAFSSQAVASMNELGFSHEKVNVNGGAIALGHPLGCSGARMVTTLIHEMRRRGARRGLATMCIGVGQGIAVCIESI